VVVDELVALLLDAPGGKDVGVRLLLLGITLAALFDVRRLDVAVDGGVDAA